MKRLTLPPISGIRFASLRFGHAAKLRKFTCAAISGICILASPSAPANADFNLNGVSDIWEQQFNNGQLFDENFDPQADLDRDGWTNIQEAAAGTDPFDPNLPNGFVRPDIVHTPAIMGEENGQPIVVTPEAVTVSWPTHVGKQYTLYQSADLSQGSWAIVGDSFIGDGGIPNFHFLTTGPNGSSSEWP